MFSEPVRTWYKDGRKDGRVIGIWPGSTLHHYRVLRNPRWEDFNYEQLDKTKNRFYWFGNGMTHGEKALVDDRKLYMLRLSSLPTFSIGSWYLDDKYVDVPPGEPRHVHTYGLYIFTELTSQWCRSRMVQHNVLVYISMGLSGLHAGLSIVLEKDLESLVPAHALSSL